MLKWLRQIFKIRCYKGCVGCKHFKYGTAKHGAKFMIECDKGYYLRNF